ncbi:MAG: ATP-binding protein [Lachnospiraceae bacterium]|nr:ATP-binding protein [Lachnospiraceae bacterium]
MILNSHVRFADTTSNKSRFTDFYSKLMERMTSEMLKKFSVKNYKNFKEEITIDFSAIAGYQFSTDCIADNYISKMLIYGRNATGKTNLGRAITDIAYTASPYPFRSPYNGILLNADSHEDAARFSYTFDFDGREVLYQYERFGNQTLKSEMLMVDGTVIFMCDFSVPRFHFENLGCIQAETANTEIYKNSLAEKINDDEERGDGEILPFLRWLINNMASESNSILMGMEYFSRRMVMTTANDKMRIRAFSSSFYDSLEDPERLKDLEEFLNAMGIECRLEWRKLPEGHGQLYFAHEKLVPFECASSGTMALVELYRRFFYRTVEPSLMYLDEFDAFYHYEMSDNVIRFIKKKYPRCQVIMTTHNTNLMANKLMRPDCVFILSRSGKLTALCNATERELREGHNLEKMYISGEFERYE